MRINRGSGFRGSGFRVRDSEVQRLKKQKEIGVISKAPSTTLEPLNPEP
jgi:hypothetical protein